MGESGFFIHFYFPFPSTSLLSQFLSNLSLEKPRTTPVFIISQNPARWPPARGGGGAAPEAQSHPFFKIKLFSYVFSSPLLDINLSFLRTHPHNLKSKGKEIIPLLSSEWFGSGLFFGSTLGWTFAFDWWCDSDVEEIGSRCSAGLVFGFGFELSSVWDGLWWLVRFCWCGFGPLVVCFWSLWCLLWFFFPGLCWCVRLCGLCWCLRLCGCVDACVCLACVRVCCSRVVRLCLGLWPYRIVCCIATVFWFYCRFDFIGHWWLGFVTEEQNLCQEFYRWGFRESCSDWNGIILACFFGWDRFLDFFGQKIK